MMPNPSLVECDPDVQQLVDDMLDLSVDFYDFEDVPDEVESSQHETHEAGGESEDLPQSPKEMDTEECRLDPANVSVTPMFRIVGDNIDRKVLQTTIVG